MTPSPSAAPGTSEELSAPLTLEDLRWLHDKYERLASEESALAGGRTSYFAGIATVLVTGFLYVVVNLLSHPVLQAYLVTFLGSLGIMISIVWLVLLRRTNSAQRLWRNSALELERQNPPVPPVLKAEVPVRGGRELAIDLSRPYESHDTRFTPEKQISWFDRRDPAFLTELLPMAFIFVWTAIIIIVWVAFAFNHTGISGIAGGDFP